MKQPKTDITTDEEKDTRRLCWVAGFTSGLMAGATLMLVAMRLFHG